jgi:predicted transcriptional regulator
MRKKRAEGLYMKLTELVEKAGLEVVVMPDGEAEIENVYTSDLLSDVMGHCPDNSVFITVQNHKNSVAVSTLVGALAILVVHNRCVPDDMIALAQQEKIAILRTSLDQFGVSCKIGVLLGICS